MDVSLAEAGKWGTLNEYAFFDKVSKKEIFLHGYQHGVSFIFSDV